MHELHSFLLKKNVYLHLLYICRYNFKIRKMRSGFMSLFIMAHLYSQAQITFQKFFNGIGRYVQQINNGGYIITGNVGTQAYLIKTNSNGDTLWTKSFNRSNGSKEGRCIIKANDGGFVLVGANTGFLPQDQGGVHLLKTDSLGNTVWGYTMGVNGNVGNAGEKTDDRGYIVAATAQNSINSINGLDAYIFKTDSFGNVVWQRLYGGTGPDGAESVQQTFDGGYIFVGTTKSFGSSSGDVYLVKLTSTGNVVWSNVYGGSGQENGNFVRQTNDHGYIIVGTSYSFGAGNGDIYLIKTDSIGNIIWNMAYGGSGKDEGLSVMQLPDGGYVLTGKTASYGAGSDDALLLRIDSIGNLIWSKTYGSTGMDAGSSLSMTMDEGFVIVGSSGFSGGGIYLIKTDSLGGGTCNEMSPTVTVSTPLKVKSSASTQTGSHGNITGGNPYSQSESRGGLESTLCTSIGVKQSEANNTFIVFPNPSDGKFSIVGSFSFPEVESITVLNLLGEVVYFSYGDFSKPYNSVQLNVPHGTYILQVSAGNWKYKHILIIE